MLEKLGTFTVSTGKLMVTDPCYDKGTWCTAAVENAAKGQWEAEVERVDCGMWGNRVQKLTVRAVGKKPTSHERLDADIGVDAGVCGVFENKPNYGDIDWAKVCDEMKTAFGGIASKGNGFHCEGAWSSSGYGDGSYDAFVGCDENGEVVEITIDYGVTPDEEDESEEEEESESEDEFEI